MVFDVSPIFHTPSPPLGHTPLYKKCISSPQILVREGAKNTLKGGGVRFFMVFGPASPSPQHFSVIYYEGKNLLLLLYAEKGGVPRKKGGWVKNGGGRVIQKWAVNKKGLFSKKGCSQKGATLKKGLFSKRGCSQKGLLSKRGCSQKEAVFKKGLLS